MASLLLSGIGMHPHEYSHEAQQAVKSIRRRSPLTRSAFSAPITKIPTPHEKQATITHSIRPLSEDIPRNVENIPVVHFQEPDSEETDTMSEGRRSMSEGSGISAFGSTAGRSRRKRRSSRTRSTFRLAQPAPTLSAKQRLLQIRPKLLLQLQRLSETSRPIPAIDVLPSTQVVPRLIKKFPRMFRGKGELGANDVMVVKSEEYNIDNIRGSEEHDSDEESLSGRELMAVICQMPKDLGGSQGKAELVLSDGTVWIATPEENGRYFQFVTIDIHGCKTTARWVRDKKLTRRSTGGIDMANLPSSNDFKFKFSIINPNTRQHPYMATLSNTTLDIPDHYTTVSAAASSSAPVSMPTTPGSFNGDKEYVQPVRTTFTIDDDLRTLIQVTGIWVALRQGLSSYFKYSDLQSSSPRPSICGRAGSFSSTPDPRHLGNPDIFSGTPESSHHGPLAVLGGRFLAKVSPAISTTPDFDLRPPPKRAISAGASFMQKTAERRLTHPPSTIISDSEGEKNLMSPLHGHVPVGAGLTPPNFHVQGSSVLTPDTPTKVPRRRGQSLSLQNGLPPEGLGIHIKRHSDEGHRSSDYGTAIKRKTSRWKTFTNFIRRKSDRSNIN